MESTPQIDWGHQLRERRGRLETAARLAPPETGLQDLLAQVDAALARIDDGTFGLCEICHDPIEADRLAVDPLLRTCLDHLSPEEQRVLERDLDLARRVQRQLLPPNPLRLDGWSAAYAYEPAGAVSGDYCDVITSPATNGGFLFLVGDATGKGVAASLLMANLQAIFRSLVAFDLAVDDLVAKANRLFCELTLSSHFATLVCGRANGDGAVDIVNAGHPYPLLLSAESDLQPIEATGMPLGLFCEGNFAARRIHIAPGDLLFAYSDGLTEAPNPDADLFGEDRLAALLRAYRHLPPDRVVGAVLEAWRAFRGPSAPADDLTLLALRRES